MKKLAFAFALLCVPAQAADTGCAVGTVEIGGCSPQAAQVMRAALLDYMSAYGDPGGFTENTTVYRHDDGDAVCGYAADGTRFVWARLDGDEPHLGVGKDAKKVWGRACH